MKKFHLTGTQKHNLNGYIFVAPWIIGFVCFLMYPLVQSLVLSFGRITNIKDFDFEFLGLYNYSKAFLIDVDFMPAFIESVTNTLVITPLVIVYSLFIAILLNRKLRFKGLFRAVFFLPVLLGTGLVMQQLLGMSFDDLNENVKTGLNVAENVKSASMAGGITLSDSILVYLGPEMGDIVQNLLNKVTTIFWSSGIQILIFIGALQAIPNYLYESSRIDGATEWEMFWKITLPMISPTILLNSVFTLIDSFTKMDNAIMRYTIKQSFEKIELGYGSALGWIFFIFVFLIVGLVFLSMRRFIYYLGEK